MRTILRGLAALMFCAVLLGALVGPAGRESDLRSYFVANGPTEIGAPNLVTAIYLGYRAFDTLGETVVLVVAVSGFIALVGGKR